MDLVRVRVSPTAASSTHPSSLAGFVSSLIEVTCDVDLLACARNTVLREISGDWVVFIDDEVELRPRWLDCLGRDLERANARTTVGCSIGTSVSALDIAYRRAALDAMGSFPEPRNHAWTSDLEMQLRLVAAGHEVQRGDRCAD